MAVGPTTATSGGGAPAGEITVGERIGAGSARRGGTTAQGDARAPGGSGPAPELFESRVATVLIDRRRPAERAPLRRGARRRGGPEEGDDRVGAAPGSPPARSRTAHRSTSQTSSDAAPHAPTTRSSRSRTVRGPRRARRAGRRAGQRRRARRRAVGPSPTHPHEPGPHEPRSRPGTPSPRRRLPRPGTPWRRRARTPRGGAASTPTAPSTCAPPDGERVGRLVAGRRARRGARALRPPLRRRAHRGRAAGRPAVRGRRRPASTR